MSTYKTTRARGGLPAVAILSFIAVVMLSGCRTLIQETENGPWSGISPGGLLILNQPALVPQDRARVFFVNGRARGSGASYRPSCALEVRRISRDGPQTIPAGEIRITRVQSYWAEVVDIGRPDGAAWRLASHGDGDGGDAMIQTGFHFWLDDPKDRNLMRLTCLGVFANPAEAYPPTLEDIRSALGRLATLDLVSIRP